MQLKLRKKSLNQRTILPSPRLKDIRQKFGNVYSKGEKYDNAIALVFVHLKATGEDVVELSVHGGIFIVEKPWSLF